jgi:hypothetical protein
MANGNGEIRASEILEAVRSNEREASGAIRGVLSSAGRARQESIAAVWDSVYRALANRDDSADWFTDSVPFRDRVAQVSDWAHRLGQIEYDAKGSAGLAGGDGRVVALFGAADHLRRQLGRDIIDDVSLAPVILSRA